MIFTSVCHSKGVGIQIGANIYLEFNVIRKK